MTPLPAEPPRHWHWRLPVPPGTLARVLVFAGYSATVASLIAWHGWISPPGNASPVAVVAALLVPLLIPLPGLVRGRAYTHAWASMIALAYFTLGVAHTAAAAERSYGMVQIAASLTLFFGCILYARFPSRS